MKHHTYKAQKRYTAIRRFYAWTGFLFLLVAVPSILAFFIWAHVYLARHGFTFLPF